MNQNPCYCANTRHGAQILVSIYDKFLAPCGMTIAQYRLLSCLASLQTANITQWAEAAGLERTTMVRNVHALAKSGWLERTEGAGKTYKLSAAGLKLIEQAEPRWEEAQNKIESILGTDDAQALLRISAKLEEKGLVQ